MTDDIAENWLSNLRCEHAYVCQNDASRSSCFVLGFTIMNIAAFVLIYTLHDDISTFQLR